MGSVLNGKRTVMPVIDWSRHTPKEWLENYGAWLDDNPLAWRVSMDTKSPSQTLIEMMTLSSSSHTRKKPLVRYDMTDTEGFVLMHILRLFHLSDDSGMAHVVSCLHISNLSYSEVERLNDGQWSIHEIRRLEQLGLGWLTCAMSGIFQLPQQL